jgi:AraC-like DNA-binding protein
MIPLKGFALFLRFDTLWGRKAYTLREQLLEARTASARFHILEGARRLIEVFRHEVGLTPKVYCRLSRFRAAVGTVATVPTVDWAATASACGYFDQSHFIHEFREFAGMSPSAYLRHRTASPNHVRLPG